MHVTSHVAINNIWESDHLWHLFETEIDGEAQVDEDLYWMRVGLHLNRPMQAIMTMGKFLKMKPASKWENGSWRLKVLDPKRGPDNCMYEYYDHSTKDNNRLLSTWKPQYVPMYNPNQFAYLQPHPYQQGTLMGIGAAPTLTSGGINTTGGVTWNSTSALQNAYAQQAVKSTP